MAEQRTESAPVDLARYRHASNEFAHLSLRDLIEARDFYHTHLARHPNVVATALGPYRIRKEDSWPNDKRRHHGTGRRTLENSEARPYSWPSVLVFVSRWEDSKAFAHRPNDLVPSTLYMPDGRRIPVCVVEAPRQERTDQTARDIAYPTNNIGPGQPLIARVQERAYVATVTCLVSDGHKVYALTNQHVTGEEGEVVFARVGGGDQRIGVSSSKKLTRLPLTELYPSFAGRDTFVNVDVGLVDLDNLDNWTAKVRDIGVVGPMADYSDINLSLSLVGCRVRGRGAASGPMLGEIHALFYRYKTSGGFEYVADLLIGPRNAEPHARRSAAPAFQTLPGDSGTLWLLEPDDDRQHGKAVSSEDFLPLAVQWGRNMLYSAGAAPRRAMGWPRSSRGRARF